MKKREKNIKFFTIPTSVQYGFKRLNLLIQKIYKFARPCWVMQGESEKDMENFTTDELRYIRGMAGDLYHKHVRKDKEKALIYKTICSKAQNEIIKRNRAVG